MDMATQHPTTYTEALGLIAELRQRMISPGWGIPIAGETLARIRVLAREPGMRGHLVEVNRVDAFMGDLDYLKQWNIAAGSQERTNALIRPALTLRLGDCAVIGQVDGADMFLFAFPAGQGDAAMAAIAARLRQADVTEDERRRFARAVCRRREGPLAGDVRYAAHLAGWRIAQPLYPTLTVRGYYHVPVCELEHIFFHGDRAVFDQKAARGIGR
jgi:hypothetical protein